MVTFHIGHHKTATTWLQQGLFKEHPSIYLLNDPRKPWTNSVLFDVVSESVRSFDANKSKDLFDLDIEKQNPSSCLLYSAERLSGHPLTDEADSFRATDSLFFYILMLRSSLV